MRDSTKQDVDGLPPGEGAFLPCTFWLADNYVLQGRQKEAEEVFQRLLALCNDVGLISEEYDPKRAGSSAISRKRSRMSDSSTRR